MPRGVDHLKARASGLVRPLGFRVIILIVAFAVLAAVYIKHLFTLQIVRGEEYLNTFQLRIKREVSIPSTRGSIYDRNGKILAANDLAYAVAIRDTYEESGRNTRLNSTINRVLDIIERNGDSITATFGIGMGENGYIYTLDGASRLRFIADIYGRTSADDLTYEEKTKTPDDIIRDLAERYQLGQKTASEDGDGQVFVIDSSYSAQRLLDIITIRYRLSLNAYQKYLTTTIAFNVSGQTVADILALAGEGAKIEKEDGSEVQPGETVGSGMILVKPDGTREVIIILGDNDGDGKVTAADARFALRIAVHLETPNAWQLRASLVTGGETVTAADARAILRAAVALEPLPLI